MKRSDDSYREAGQSRIGGKPGEAVAERTSISLGEGWTAGLSAIAGGAVLRVEGGGQESTMEIVISLTSAGPVLRARAAAVEIVADRDIVARCDRFRVEARKDVTLVAGETMQTQGRRVDIEATHGTARVRANDNVQLLGENVLLNCEQPAPSIPTWAGVLAAVQPPRPLMPAASTSGDASLLVDVTGEPERAPE